MRNQVCPACKTDSPINKNFCYNCGAPSTFIESVGVVVLGSIVQKWVHKEAFLKFMEGQTYARIDDENAYYWDDVLKFMNNQPVTD